MPERDWDKELAKIDKKMESVSDEQIFPTKTAQTPAERAEIGVTRARTKTFGIFLRLLVAVGLGVGIMFWPYPARCGIYLAYYLAAVAAVTGAGVWSAIWTWRHRAPSAHVLSLLIVLWGIVLGAIEILPRAGYARPTPEHPATWGCE